ncbi:MAG: lysophospholipid acyltransferase family protein [Myxococcota bacterium]
MPRALRILLTFASFGMFFGAGLGLVVGVLPILFLASALDPQRHRARFTRALGRLYPAFLFWMRLVGLIDYRLPELPPDVPRDRPYLLVANHPTLIDVLFCLAAFPGITSLVKAAHYRSRWLFGVLLRSTLYVPGAGAEGDEGHDGEHPPVVERMVRQLEAGHSLVAFPEGTRAPPHRLTRFRRGAFEAAVRARVPIACLYIGVDHPALTKGRFLPSRRLHFRFDWLPTVDCAALPEPSSRVVRNEVFARYRAQHEAYLASLPSSEEAAPASG